MERTAINYFMKNKKRTVDLKGTLVKKIII